nr:hypothetical protein [Bacillota bacterium]
MQPLRIAVLTPESRVSAGYHYRVAVPFFSAVRSGRVRLLFPGDGGLSLDAVLAQADVVLVQRMVPVPGWDVAHLVKALRRARIPLVYELDDDLTNLPATNPRRAYWEGKRDAVVRLVSEADMVVVATEALRARFGQENGNVFVFPNHLDPDVLANHGVVRRPRPAGGRALCVGYAGSPTHEADLRQVEAVLADLAARYTGRLSFCFYGCATPALRRLPGVSLRPTGHYYRYLQRLVALGVDVGVAPLVSHPFNACKSPVKYLEYTFAGIPGVYATLPPYAETVRHGVTGWVAATAEEWAAGIERLLADDALRRAMVDAAWAACAGPEARRRLEADRAAYLARLLNLAARREPR